MCAYSTRFFEHPNRVLVTGGCLKHEAETLIPLFDHHHMLAVFKQVTNLFISDIPNMEVS